MDFWGNIMVYMVMVLLLLLSAFFSASETALTSISKARIQILKKNHGFGVSSLIALRKNPGKMLTTILIGNNIANISASALFTVVVMEYFKQITAISLSYLTAIVSGVMTVIVLVFCEVTPKNIALSKTTAMALVSAPIIWGLSWLLTPIIWGFNYISTLFLKLLKGPSLSKGSLVSEEEVIALIDAGEEQGVFEEEETQMLKDVIEFGDKTVKEAMLPLKKVVSAGINRTLDEVVDLIEKRPHSRIPIYKDFSSNIIGLLYAKDLLLIINDDNRDLAIKDFENLLRKPFYVDKLEELPDILNLMRTYKAHLAIVRDEENNAEGIITIEDILEEIVGEITDEYD